MNVKCQPVLLSLFWQTQVHCGYFVPGELLLSCSALWDTMRVWWIFHTLLLDLTVEELQYWGDRAWYWTCDQWGRPTSVTLLSLLRSGVYGCVRVCTYLPATYSVSIVPQVHTPVTETELEHTGIRLRIQTLILFVMCFPCCRFGEQMNEAKRRRQMEINKRSGRRDPPFTNNDRLWKLIQFVPCRGEGKSYYELRKINMLLRVRIRTWLLGSEFEPFH